LLLASNNGMKTILEKGNKGRLPIHNAFLAGARIKVIRLLLDSDDDKKTILVKDDKGQLPIHLACRKHTSVKVVQLLLDSDIEKKSIFQKGRLGRLPIHLACGKYASVKAVQLLLDSDIEKKSILEKDNVGWLPINYACGANTPVEKLRLLLQVSIGNRIEQLGLEQWRIGVEELINALTADDSKAKKVQEIYERLSKYEEMEHALSLLALAVWRTSCLHWGGITFKSMQEIEDLQATDDAFHPAEYKRERRIRSGADVIIRGVLPFLPVDDETPTPNAALLSVDDDSDSESTW
jgi:hypothetical protein